MAKLNFPDPSVVQTYTAAGITWTWNATKNVWSSELEGGDGGASVSVGPNPPAGAEQGDLWWNSDDTSGRLYVYYEDADSSQWVEASPLGPDYDDTYLKLDASNGPVTGNLEISTGIDLNTDGTAVFAGLTDHESGLTVGNGSPRTGSTITNTTFSLYETGTWTPVFDSSNITGTITIGTTVDCTYTRIGDLVFLFAASIPLNGTSGTWRVGNSVNFTGLPYEPALNSVGSASITAIDTGTQFKLCDFNVYASGTFDQLSCIVSNTYTASGNPNDNSSRSLGIRNISVTYRTAS